uniref:Uncharacterized protein n=1 Tax=Oryza glumipatula TaxID=40148 RepID=A0A0D9ZX10_9ORYZ
MTDRFKESESWERSKLSRVIGYSYPLRNPYPSRFYKLIPGSFSSKPNLPFALPSPKTLAAPKRIRIAPPARCRTPGERGLRRRRRASRPVWVAGVWKGVARVAFAAVGASREPLNMEDRASNTCKRRRQLATPVSSAPCHAPSNSAVSPSRGKPSRLEQCLVTQKLAAPSIWGVRRCSHADSSRHHAMAKLAVGRPRSNMVKSRSPALESTTIASSPFLRSRYRRAPSRRASDGRRAARRMAAVPRRRRRRVSDDAPPPFPTARRAVSARAVGPLCAVPLFGREREVEDDREKEKNERERNRVGPT